MKRTGEEVKFLNNRCIFLFTEEMKDGFKILIAFAFVILFAYLVQEYLNGIFFGIYMVAAVVWFSNYAGKIIKKHYP